MTTRAPRRHPATAAAADLRTWVQRWPDAPLPAIQMVNAWLDKAAAAKPKPEPARTPKGAQAPAGAPEAAADLATAHPGRKAASGPATTTATRIARPSDYRRKSKAAAEQDAERIGDRNN